MTPLATRAMRPFARCLRPFSGFGPRSPRHRWDTLLRKEKSPCCRYPRGPVPSCCAPCGSTLSARKPGAAVAGVAQSMSTASIVRDTTAALLEPKRLVPILVVCVPLIWLETLYSRDVMAGPHAVAMCVAFVFVAPMAWRALSPDGQPAL